MICLLIPCNLSYAAKEIRVERLRVVTVVVVAGKEMQLTKISCHNL